MNDSTVKKVQSRYSPKVDQGQTYLVSGKRVAMRMWQESPEATTADTSKREYGTVGYVIAGRAELETEGQTVLLEAGDSWLVPAEATHRYRILEHFTAFEATAPPAQVHGRE